MGEQWNTYLQIDHQGFCVVEQTSRARAQWFGKMLAVALDRMLSDNDPVRHAGPVGHIRKAAITRVVCSAWFDL